MLDVHLKMFVKVYNYNFYDSEFEYVYFRGIGLWIG